MTDRPLSATFTSYTSSEFGFIMASSIVSILSGMSSLLAFMNERPAFVSICNQINVVYSLLADWLIFNLTPSLIEGICITILVLLFLNLAR